MEGLIPYVYRAIVDYKNGGGGGGLAHMQSSSSSSPSFSYIRLPGDSGRFQVSDIQIRADFGFRSSPSASAAAVKAPVYRRRDRLVA